jgi:hypothetical protein
MPQRPVSLFMTATGFKIYRIRDVAVAANAVRGNAG